MVPRASDPRLGLRLRIRSMSRSFGSVLVLIAFGYWYSEAYGTARWLALPLILSMFGAILVALRAISPERLSRHAVAMVALVVTALVGAAVDRQGLLSIPLTGVPAYSAFGLVMILRYVLSRPTITSNVILGAICCFLLLGGVFSWVYGFGAAVNPEILAPPIDATLGPQGIGYFSFMTLTTVGYGDIVPAFDWVRAVVVIEALTGQVFLVVLIARLVGMQVAQRPPGSTPGGSPAAV